MKKYIIEYDGQGPAIVEILENGTLRYQFENSNFFVELRESENDSFTYKWNHGEGSGEVTIPGHVFFDIPAFATILNHFKNGSYFSESRIYEQMPIAQLFKKDS